MVQIRRRVPGWVNRAGWGAALTLGIMGSAAGAEPSFFQQRVEPILDRHCVACHGPEKQKAELRLDRFEHLMKGSDAGEVVKPGDVKASELFRRITLPKDHEEFMPPDGKPPLAADEVKVLELWIAGGADAAAAVAAFPDAPAPRAVRSPGLPLAPDWRPRQAQLAALQAELGVKLVPRSQIPTDGLVLRTASAPGRATDAALARLEGIADLIVEAELARTAVTDAGLASLGRWTNLRKLDLTRTQISSAGVGKLTGLQQLEVLNLTDTSVDDAGFKAVQALPGLKRLWVFGTRVSASADGAEGADGRLSSER